MLEQLLQIFTATFLGMSIWQIIGGAFFMVLFIVLRKLFTKVVIGWLTKLTKKTKTDLDDRFLTAITNPIRLIPIIMGVFFFALWFEIPEDAVKFLMMIVRSMIAFTIFWMFFNILKPLETLSIKMLGKIFTEQANEFGSLFIKCLRIATLCLGLIVILSQWGINVWPFLTGLGIVGIAFAYGAQNTISNMFGGVKLLADKQFIKGDWIKTPDVEGTVEELGFISTRIRLFDTALTTIPNSKLAGSVITNFSRMTNRKISLTLGLTYDTDIPTLDKIVNDIKEYLLNNKDVDQDKTLRVNISGLGDSSIDIFLYYFLKTTSGGDKANTVEENIKEYIRIVNEAGSSFAFPSQSIYVESMPKK